MPGNGRPYRTSRAAFKAECAIRNEPCHICIGTRGPIDYTTNDKPLSFSLDHRVPTSLGGAMVSTDNYAASHLSCNSSRGDGTRGQFPTSRRW